MTLTLIFVLVFSRRLEWEIKNQKKKEEEIWLIIDCDCDGFSGVATLRNYLFVLCEEIYIMNRRVLLKICSKAGKTMDYRTREFINELAEAVIAYYQITIPITNIDEVVTTIGGRIVTTSTAPSLFGGLTTKKGGSFEIWVGPFQTKKRRKFAIAHELGHLFIHMGYRINDEIWDEQDERPYYRYGNTEMEYQANEFAGALLMPRQQYYEVMNRFTKGNIVDTAKIAEHFHVSVDAASNRGKWLGYLVGENMKWN